MKGDDDYINSNEKTLWKVKAEIIAKNNIIKKLFLN